MSEKMKNALDMALNEMFRESQSALPDEDKSALRSADMCLDEHDGYKCTKVKGHIGDHIAHGSSGVIAKW